MRYLLYLGAFLVLCLYQSCSSESEPEPEQDPDFLKISGRVLNSTGQPVPGVQVQLCKGVHYGNGPATIGEKKLLGTSDLCGYFSVEIDPAEAGYGVHAGTSDGVVLSFEHCSYGHWLQAFHEFGEHDVVIKRPFLDSVRWFIDSQNLIIEVRRNNTSTPIYYEMNTTEMSYSYDPIQTNSRLALWEVVDGKPASVVTVLEETPSDEWVSFIVSGIEGEKAYNFYIEGGNGARSVPNCYFSDLGQVISIGPTERPDVYVYALPEEDLCGE